jgi:hypothetical protein
MGCTEIRTKTGVVFSVCGRGRGIARTRTCSSCYAPFARFLCDFPLAGRKRGKTCDRALCEKCRRPQPTPPPPGTDIEEQSFDFCPTHDELARGARAEVAPETGPCVPPCAALAPGATPAPEQLTFAAPGGDWRRTP